MGMSRRSLIRAAVAAAVLFHGVRVAQKKSLPVSLLTLLGNLTSTAGFWGIVAGDIIGLVILSAAIRWLRRVSLMSLEDIKDALASRAYEMSLAIPMVAHRVEEEMNKTEGDLRKSMLGKGFQEYTAIPEKGLTGDFILETLEGYYAKEAPNWKNGRVSGGVYHGGDEHVALLNKAAGLYAVANPLHTDIWPSLRQLEADVIKMTADLVRGTCETVCGSFTSGGTESIILATRAHKEYAARFRGVTHPEVIACYTAHAAIDKACEMFNIHLVRVPPVEGTFEMDVAAVRRAISSDTVMIYTSAPNFPNGMIDPIAEIAEIAHAHGIGVHVDACLGGFVLPFAEKLGYSIPSFNFSNRGVTSMSLDTHKFGSSVKGSSVVLYRNKALRRSQYFTYPQWRGGLYCTATVAGSRPGALVAATWASLVHIGMEGFLDTTDKIMKTAIALKKGIQKQPGVKLLGDPPAMVVALGSDEYNIYFICDFLSHRGWNLNALQKPASIHLCVTKPMCGLADDFLSDLADAIEDVKTNPDAAELATGAAPIYGTTSSLPAGPVSDVLGRYIDTTLS
eukprot:CAMPEP_0119157398 /NCGR_PEP_ID=MMETSP1310-20130426/52735_1 /TAXON_ID=464262 /ORGANISM="Genus nov. species nov., Strain RCC2339" /LENGTH=564 /DNA_ID=CAMNT_0007150015 /DNA_START=56 /DNA_END=1750 /DNA_ORIENTATION=-